MTLDMHPGPPHRTEPPEELVDALLSFYQKVTDADRDAKRLLLHRELVSRGEGLIAHAAAIESLVEASPARLLREVTRAVRETGVQVVQLADGLRSPFMLFVIGMGKFGKSTLINALVGSRVADMDVLPKTWKIDVFSASQPDGQVMIKTRTGELFQLSVSQATEFLAKEEEKRIASEDRVYDELTKRSRNLRTVEQKEELLRALRKELLYHSQVTEVHWPCPRSEFLSRFDIIDTPGLIQELAGEVQDDLRAYYHKADGVLWMLDATKVASQKARELLQEMDEALSQVGGRSDNIIGVLNRIDLISPADRPALVKEAERIYKGLFVAIVPFSAKWALEGVEKGDRRAEQASGLADLKREIDDRFLSRAVQLQMESKIKGFDGYIHDLQAKIRVYLHRLEQDANRRQEVADELETRAAQTQQHLSQTFAAAMRAHAESVKANLASLTVRLFEMESEQRKAFLTEHILEEKALSAIMQQGSQALREQAANLLEYMHRKSVFHGYPLLDDAALPAEIVPLESKPREIQVDLDTFGGQLFAALAAGGVAAIFLGPVGWLAALLAFTHVGKSFLVETFFLRDTQHAIGARASQLNRQIRREYDQTVERTLQHVKDQVTKAREDSFAALHGPSSRLTEVVELLRIPSDLAGITIETPDVREVMLGRHLKRER